MSDEETFDVVELTKANSAQLNAVDLVGGPATVRILGVKNNNSADGKQPIKVLIDGGFKPWFPCLTMRRMMIGKWGNPAKWVGRSVTIYNDPAVTYGKNKTGGVRVSHMSNLSEPFDVTLPTRRNEYTTYTIRPLATPGPTTAPTGNQRPPNDAPASLFTGWAVDVRKYLNVDPEAVADWYEATYAINLRTATSRDVMATAYGKIESPAGMSAFRSSPFGGAS